MIKIQIEQRLQELNWTLYKLSKQVAATKAARVGEEPSAATRYHSAIGKALDNPARSRLETILEIVEALGGTLQIIWENKPGLKVTHKFTGKQYMVKYFKRGIVIQVEFYAFFRDALKALQFTHDKDSHIEISLDDELLCTSEDVQFLLRQQQQGYPVKTISQLTPDNSWVCIVE